MFVYRSINLPSQNGDITKSTLALEPVFWEAIDDIFGRNWRHWAIEELQNKPEEQSKSSCIRQAILLVQRNERPINVTLRLDLAKPHAIVDATDVPRPIKKSTTKKYSDKSVFPKEGKEKLTVNLDTDTNIELAALAKKCRMSRGEFIDELIRDYGHKIKPRDPVHLR